MEATFFGALAFAALSIASARVYGRAHGDQDYDRDDRDRMDSPREFEAVYTWIRYSTFGFGMGALLWPASVWLVPVFSIPQMVIGLVIAWVGFLLLVQAFRTLGQQYSPCYDSRLPTETVRSGLYARIRHPIYTANLVTLFGCAIATGSAWIALNWVLLGVYYWRSAVREERALAELDPDYAAHCERTGRFLPRLGPVG